MRKLFLVIEKGADMDLWGRVSFEDNLIVDSAPSLESLDRKIKIILHDLHRIEPASMEFEITHITLPFSEPSNFLPRRSP